MRHHKYKDGVFLETVVTPDPAEDLIAAIKGSCQRRICTLVGADTAEKATIKQLNLNARAAELSFKATTEGPLDAAELAEAAQLRETFARIKALRARSDEIEALVGSEITTVEQVDEQTWPA